jgi:acyl-CoA synthetase (AMP-forming)/AMP-acid ligase II/3-oxoacyl-(acyl-carrier-protein) synthase/acyl carrier protein
MSSSPRSPLETRAQTLCELLQLRAREDGERIAYTFLEDGEQEAGSLTYGELDRRARAVAASLQEIAEPGERALLLYPSGLDVLAAIFGALYAGVVAIPVPPPNARRLQRTLPRLQSIVEDAGATMVLTTSEILERVGAELEDVPRMRAITWVATEALPLESGNHWVDPGIVPDTLAYLQYTSGSTSAPKGVMLRHDHVLLQCEMTRRSCGYTPDAVTVGWMPYFHDYGLVEGILQPLYNGTPYVFMPPLAFIKQPVRWLRAIERYGATHSQGPNFAYDQCVRRITEEECADLDLSRWRSAGSGAEPNNPRVMEAFAEKFAPCGFRFGSLTPAYGLAEATQFVSTTPVDSKPAIARLDAAALERKEVVFVDGQNAAGQVRLIAGCGQPVVETALVIVDPETRLRSPDDRIGEIWLASPSVATGYWNRAEETREAFEARLADTDEGPFLRTGDLGFLRDGELYMTGRLKEMIIVRGTNHAPQDIEWSVQAAHPALRPDHGAAFSVDEDGNERLVVAQEVDRQHLATLDVTAVVTAIRNAVAEEHGIEVHAIALLPWGTMPKTSSGKIRRRGCRSLFLDESLETVARWSVRDTRSQRGAPVDLAGDEDLARWLLTRTAALLEIDPDLVDPSEPLASYGLDSLKAVRLAGELEQHLGRPLPDTLAYEHPSLDEIANFVSGGVGRRRGERRRRRQDEEPLAIVGLGCRFPGAKNPDELWTFLQRGGDAITEVPTSRWNTDAVYDPTPSSPGHTNTRSGGFLDEIDRFDAEFFGISPKEAAQIDPQHRLLLEVAWEALEHAGIAPSSLAGTRTGVFVGISSNDYSRLQAGRPSLQTAYAATGNAQSMAASRISYVLDLQGPNWAVDTACSSSLVALHQACQSLRAGECNTALVGGVNLILDPTPTVAFSQSGMMSPDGRCKAFSAAADGYGRAEGCGVVVVRPLADALRDRDHVYAVVRGSAVNHDGRSNGITAPNGAAQVSLIRDALADAGTSPAEIGYVEAHGTGTALGDPIEMQALQDALDAEGAARQRCFVGSVKTNIGHTEAAAGIAGVIKVALALDRGGLPPHLHLDQLNPRISLDGTSFAIATARESWPRRTDRSRIAGVSSFSFGGTNAHAILAEGPLHGQPLHAAAANGRSQEEGAPLHLLTLSALSETALATLAQTFAQHLETTTDDLADICFTANTGRSCFRHRLAVFGANSQELAARLRQAPQGGQAAPIEGVMSGSVRGRGGRRVALVADSIDGPPMQDLFELAPTLQRAERDQAPQVDNPFWLTASVSGVDDRHALLEAVAALWVAGVPIDFHKLDAGTAPRRVAVPTYPFQRRRYWFGEEGGAGAAADPSGNGREAERDARTLNDEELEGLSESEAEALLLRKLDRMDY